MRSTFVVQVVGAVVILTVAVLTEPASGDVKSTQAQIAQLGRRVAQDGAQVQQLVVRYDQAEARATALQAQLDVVRTRLVADRRAESRVTRILRQFALNDYMSGTADDSASSLFDAADNTSVEAKQEYAQVATEGVRQAIDAVEVDAQRTGTEAAKLRSAQSQAEATVRQLSGARQAAQAALANDDALLGSAQGNLQALLAAEARRYAAAEQAAEQSMAAHAAAARAAAAAAAAATSRSAAAPPPVTVTITPSAGSYGDPLRAVNALVPDRIDQGVDYGGYGPIYALGDGVVLSTVNSGWPGGTFISYRLSDGPANGLVVYAAEDIDPAVVVGQSVTAATVLGDMYEGPVGIETGWADASGDGTSMANDAGQFSGANSTAFGANFSLLLASLGAPAGIAQNDPPTGSLPPGWPTW